MGGRNYQKPSKARSPSEAQTCSSPREGPRTFSINHEENKKTINTNSQYLTVNTILRGRNKLKEESENWANWNKKGEYEIIQTPNKTKNIF